MAAKSTKTSPEDTSIDATGATSPTDAPVASTEGAATQENTGTPTDTTPPAEAPAEQAPAQQQTPAVVSTQVIAPVTKDPEPEINDGQEIALNDNFGFTVTVSGNHRRNGTYTAPLKKITQMLYQEECKIVLISKKSAARVLKYLEGITAIDGVVVRLEKRKAAIEQFKKSHGL